MWRLIENGLLESSGNLRWTGCANKFGELARGGEADRICMVEVGAADFIVKFITKSFEGKRIVDLQEAVRILHLTWIPNDWIKLLVRDNHELIDLLTWILRLDDDIDNNYVEVKGNSISTMNLVIEVTSTILLERLQPETLVSVVNVLRDKRLISQQGIVKSAQQILTNACPLGRNRLRMLEEGVFFELVEVELRKQEKRITELTFNLLVSLCSCADGREQLLQQEGAFAVVAKRTLRVSPAVDDRAIQVLCNDLQVLRVKGGRIRDA